MKKNVKQKIVISIVAIISIAILAIGISYMLFINTNHEYYISEKNINIPIFVYHDIVEEMTGEEYMQTTKENFEKQILGLREIGYQIITYDDLIAYHKGEKKINEKSFLITCDDGIEGNYKVMFPIIKKHNIPVAINIVDNNVGTVGALTWEQIKEMSDSGLVDIYTHSRYHKDANMVSTEKYVEDIKYAHNHIEEKLGKKVTKVFTYPYGLNGEEKIEALKKEGFIQNLTDNKVNKSKTLDLSRLHREYPLNDSVSKILLKTFYRSIRYH